jgi:hypothetical protein
MGTLLYDLSVACYLQTLGAVADFLERGRLHNQNAGADADRLVEMRIFPDMAPLRFQVVAIAHHSVGAIEGIRRGVFRSDFAPQPRDYARLQKIASDAVMALKALVSADINALAGKEVVFQIGERTLSFTAENFVLSFSLPQFHFHSTTAYDILRASGVPLGKRDYMGPLRMKSPAAVPSVS